MEAIGAFLDEEWESLGRIFSSEDSDTLLNFSGSNLFSSSGESSSTFTATYENVHGGVDESLFFPSDSIFYPNNFNCINSQESSDSSEIESLAFFPNGVTNNNNTFDQSMDFYTMDCRNDNQIMVPIFPDDIMEEILKLKEEMSNGQLEADQPAAETHSDSCNEMQLKRKYEKECKETSMESPKQRTRVSKGGQKNKRTGQAKKNKKVVQTGNSIVEEEMSNGGVNGQSSNSCTSENNDDSNASNDSESKASVNSNGKARASRGSATDPQSLYARRRRERINERLRILQNLVPNGTKVDISTMLEEAVHYVKFLQLQIKLLSSDDMWMYAPIAYNGMDMGLYQKIALNQWPLN